MTMPKREQILQLARELYAEQCYKNGIPEITPEDGELLENGFYAQAKSELMMCLSRKTEEFKEYAEQIENFTDFQFDCKEAMQTTTFISGSRGVGKSDIAMQIVNELTTEGIICVAFDSSLDWIRRSSISRYVTVQPYSDLSIPNENMIFDISMLTPNQQQQSVEQFSKKLFEHQINNNMANKYYVVFEESQLYFPLNSIRAKRYQHSMRILTCGRNFQVSLCAISQFPSLIDKELVKNAQQIYIGCTSEPNTLAYWKGILGKNADQLRELENGSFVYYCRNKLSKIQIKPYENHTTKTEIILPKIPQPIKAIPQNGNGIIDIVKFITIAGIVIYALSTIPK